MQIRPRIKGLDFIGDSVPTPPPGGYLPRNGSLDMTGDLDLGSNDINNVTSVNGAPDLTLSANTLRLSGVNPFELHSSTSGRVVTLSLADLTANRNLFVPNASGTIALITDITGLSWLLNGNTVGSVKFLGTLDNFDLPFRVNNIERLRIFTNGKVEAGELVTALGGLSTDGVKSISVDTTNSKIYLINQSTGTGSHKFMAGFQAAFMHIGGDIVAIGRNALLSAVGDGLVGIGFGTGEGYNGVSSFFLGESVAASGIGNYNFLAVQNSGQLINGNDNIGIGQNTLYQCLGSGNLGLLKNALYQTTGSGNKGFGENVLRGLTISNTFSVADINNIYWNNHGSNGFTTLQTVTMQTAMSEAGTNTSAAASIFKQAAARGTDDASGGNLVWQFANKMGTANGTRQTLSDGVIFEANTGYVWSKTSTSENKLLSGKYVTVTGSVTTVVGEQTFEYTGAGGHTLTLHTFVGYKNTDWVIINSGSGNLTVDANASETISGSLTVIVAAGDSITIKSNGTNGFLI